MECKRCNFETNDLDTRCSRCDFELPVNTKVSFFKKFSLRKRSNDEKQEKQAKKFNDIANAISIKASLKKSIKEISGTHPIISEDTIAKASNTKTKVNEATNKEETTKQLISEDKKIEQITTKQNQEIELETEQAKNKLDKKKNLEENSLAKEDFQIEDIATNNTAKNNLETKNTNLIETDPRVNDILKDTNLNDITDSIEDLIDSIPEIKITKEQNTIEHNITEKIDTEAEELGDIQTQKHYNNTNNESHRYELNMDEELDLDSLLKEFE